MRDAGSDPFFLMVNFSDPHAFRKPDNPADWHFPPQVDGIPEDPIPPSQDTLFPFQPLDTPEQRIRTAGYYNAVQRLDYGIGLLMEALQKSGREENTLVVFCGDHGPPFDRGKTTCYEGGLRIPFLLRWPGVTKPAVSRAMVSTTDIAPTIFEAAGVRSPARMHGRSLRPVAARAEARWREYLAGEFHFHGAGIFYPRRAIRDARYKLIHNLRAGSARPMVGIDADKAYRLSREPQYAGAPAARALARYAGPPEFELYDLREDPWELTDRASDPGLAAVRQRLMRACMDWRKETADPFLDAEMIRKYSHYRPPAR
jgi:N-sulfoglucosamine sulfohydrolase